jgi:hypothetical protein
MQFKASLVQRVRACLPSRKKIIGLIAVIATSMAVQTSNAPAWDIVGNQEFDRPFDWFVHPQGISFWNDHSEPITVVISALSDVSITGTKGPRDFVNFLSYNGSIPWGYVTTGIAPQNGACISAEAANVNDAVDNGVPQLYSARPYTCAYALDVTPDPGLALHNHFRAWFQAGDVNQNSDFGPGAYMLAVSEEHSCADISFHCIDLPGPTTAGGYIQGRHDLVDEIITAATHLNYMLAGDPEALEGNSGPAKCPEVVSVGCLQLNLVTAYAAGQDAQGVPYDGKVVLVRIKLPTAQQGVHFQANAAPAVDNLNTVRVYAHSLDGALQETYLPPGQTWHRNGMGGSLIGNPATVVLGNGTTFVFAVGDYRHLYERHLAPGASWTAWKDLGGTWSTDPVVAHDSIDQLFIYMTGDTGHVYQNFLTRGSSNWSGWQEIPASGSFDVPRSPAVLMGDGIHVFAISGQILYENVHIAGWSGWTPIPGTPGVYPTGNPKAVIDQNGTMRVYFTNAVTGTLWEAYRDPGKAWALDNQGGVFGWESNPGALVDGNGTVRVYGISNGNVYEKHLDKGSTWSDWINFGAAPDGWGWGSDPTAIFDRNGTVRVYAVSGEGVLYEKHLDAGPGKTWSGWGNLGFGPLP